jgi:hypothetical protein
MVCIVDLLFIDRNVKHSLRVYNSIISVLPLIYSGLEEDEGDATDVDTQRKTRSAVIRTSTRQTIFLPIPGQFG